MRYDNAFGYFRPIHSCHILKLDFSQPILLFVISIVDIQMFGFVEAILEVQFTANCRQDHITLSSFVYESE